MAATVMQPPAHRPSMDHVSSFDRSQRPASTVGPYASSSYDRAPSPAAAGGIPRSRTSSSTSASPAPSPLVTASSAYQQQYAVPSYYPPFPMHQQGWGGAAQAGGFYSATSFHTHAAFPNGAAPPGQFPPGAFQPGQADFSAWAHVYQQMVTGGHMPAPGHMPPPQPHQQDIDDMTTLDSTRRRTSSAPRPPSTMAGSKAPQAPPTFHPYQRGHSKHRSSSAARETDVQRRSVSTPSTPISLDGLAKLPPQPRGASPADGQGGHHRIASATNSQSGADFMPPPKLRDSERPSSVHSGSSSRSRDSANRSPAASNASIAPPRTSSPAVGASSSPAGPSSAAASIKSGTTRAAPEASAATSNALSAASTPVAQQRPSPLSQGKPLVQPPQLMADKKAVRKDKHIQKASISQPTLISHESGSPSGAMRLQPNPRAAQAPNPNAPFINVQAMTSDVSLAETERTAATTASVAGVKPKRGLFRMRNKSSDNISLSSTVSSASMMIRKMGSIGKLARRNSLMGISKIFKDKPKDDDAGLPEKQGVFSGFKKKNNKKAEAAPAAVSRSFAEVDRMGADEDRTIGLSPAAQLARQHTARSKAEAAKRAEDSRRRQASSALAAAASIPEMGGAVGEPTWESSTTTRTNPSTTPRPDTAYSQNGTTIVNVVPRGPSVVQAVQYNAGPEIESISSADGTVEDLTASMNQASLAEDDFQPLWTQAHVDYNARPKKGILKNTISNEDIETQARQRSSSTSDAVSPLVQGPLSAMPAPMPEKIDGAIHASHSNATEVLDGDKQYDPLSPTFSPFDSSPIELDLKPTIYQRPAHNTSAPSLSVGGPPVPHRAMTAPVRRRLIWAPECAVYSTYDANTYDRRSEPATCNRLTPELAMAIKQELNEFKLEMPIHPSSRVYTHYFA